MRKREAILPLVSMLLLLSSVFLFLGSSSVSQIVASGVSFLTVPIQQAVFSTFTYFSPKEPRNEQELLSVVKEVDERESEKEMQALRDQFETSDPTSTQLLPAQIVGYGGFIPTVQMPLTITLDKGSSHGVQVGQAVVYKDNLVGKVSVANAYLSQVILLTNDKLSFTGESLTNGATGVVHGGKEAIVMDNVVLSETVEKDDVIVTKGDRDAQGIGFPPSLVVGRVISTDKKQSNLFQSAQIKSLIDITSLSTVFILVR